jgi:predicted secreted protein with PEFG-CTERM motif
MKAITLGSFFVLFAIVGGLTVPTAFAQTVSAPAGSSVPGCEDTDECFIPSTVTIGVGETVTWSNDDTAAHTVTGGNAADGPSGVFDSSLFMAGTEFSHTFDEAGTFEYFCMVHPWMVGNVIVGGEGMMGGDELMVTITKSATAKQVQIDLEFNQVHVNYEIIATQNGNEVLREEGHAHTSMMTSHNAPGFVSDEEGHAHTSMMTSHNAPGFVSDENPMDVEVVSLGIGLPGEEWTGPTGTIGTKQIVPEFGTIAMMILGVAIVSIIALSAKSRVIPRL